MKPFQVLYVQWMKELFPACEIVHLDIHHPQDPSETNEFWDIWTRTLLGFPFEPIDFVFASELYGQRIASIFNATFIPVDIPRESVEISATKIRRDPMRYWNFIPSNVQDFYRQKVSVFGPESTGKTTLTKRLTEHFEGTFVPEFARGYFRVSSRGVCRRYADHCEGAIHIGTGIAA